MRIKTKFFLRNLQKYGWDCGVSAVAFLLDVKGKNLSRRGIIKILGASKEGGTDLVKIVEFFKNLPEFEAGEKSNWSTQDLEKEVDRGRVCLVAYQNWDKPKDVGKPDYGHYGVVYKIEKGRIYLFDPGTPTGMTDFSKEEFEKRWYEDDLGVHYVRWAMSINLE